MSPVSDRDTGHRTTKSPPGNLYLLYLKIKTECTFLQNSPGNVHRYAFHVSGLHGHSWFSDICSCGQMQVISAKRSPLQPLSDFTAFSGSAVQRMFMRYNEILMLTDRNQEKKKFIEHFVHQISSKKRH